MQLWTVTDTQGSIVVPCFQTSDAATPPNAAGCPWSVGYVAYPISIVPDPVRLHTWSGRAWVESPTLVEAMLISAVKATNAGLVQTLYSVGYGKQKKYSRKQQEVSDWHALSSTVQTVTGLLALFNALPALTQKQKFRFAINDAAVRGDTIDKAIARFEAGINVEDQVASWEAIELKACADIKAASTAAAKRAVYAAIVWTRTPS